MANIVVTGGLGWIGREVVKQSLAAGHKVGVLDYLPKPAGLNIPYAQADIVSVGSVLGAFNELREQFTEPRRRISTIDAVFHLAALFDYGSSFSDLYKVNVQGTENVAQASVLGCVKKIIHLGAAASYGDDHEEAIKENFKLKPTEDYGLTKMLAEKVLLDYNLPLLKVATLRAPMIYGKDCKGAYMFNRFKAAEGPLIDPMKQTSNSYAHREDIARAVVHAFDDGSVFMNKAENISDVAWNLADDDPMTEGEVTELLGYLMTGKERKFLPIMPYPLLQLAAHASKFVEKGLMGKARSTLDPDMVKHSQGSHVLDNKKFKDVTGFEYKYPSVKLGFPGVVKWFKENT